MPYLRKVLPQALVLNLVIDIGNNSTKYYLFGGQNIILRGRYPNDSFRFVQEIVPKYGIERIIVSSVVELSAEQKEQIDGAGCTVVWFDNSTPTPLKTAYRTPHTLGSDRLAAAVGAVCRAPGRDILVIDAGSAVTIDFVDAGGVFRGGNISPGIKMRLTALHRQTSRLPQVDKDGEIPTLGHDTETAIRSGVIRGMCHEIDGYISEFREKYPDILVFLTGGDEKILTDNIKNAIFADKFLVAKGLNHILENINRTCRYTEKY